MSGFTKYALSWGLFSLVVSFGLQYFLNIPIGQTFLFCLSGFFALPAFGLLITLEDDLPRGFDNPDGDMPFPWKLIGGIILLGCFAALSFYVSVFAFRW